MSLLCKVLEQGLVVAGDPVCYVDPTSGKAHHATLDSLGRILYCHRAPRSDRTATGGGGGPAASQSTTFEVFSCASDFLRRCARLGSRPNSTHYSNLSIAGVPWTDLKATQLQRVLGSARDPHASADAARPDGDNDNNDNNNDDDNDNDHLWWAQERKAARRRSRARHEPLFSNGPAAPAPACRLVAEEEEEEEEEGEEAEAGEEEPGSAAMATAYSTTTTSASSEPRHHASAGDTAFRGLVPEEVQAVASRCDVDGNNNADGSPADVVRGFDDGALQELVHLLHALRHSRRRDLLDLIVARVNSLAGTGHAPA